MVCLADKKAASLSTPCQESCLQSLKVQRALMAMAAVGKLGKLSSEASSTPVTRGDGGGRSPQLLPLLGCSALPLTMMSPPCTNCSRV